MKKLLILMLAAVVIGGCTQSGNGSEEPTDSDSSQYVPVNVTTSGVIVKKTLNGIEYSDAQKMINNFYIARNKPQTVVENVTFFLNKRMVEKILAYLLKEGNDVDGIRFYPAKKSESDNETFLLLVSTKKGTAVGKHKDYYEHDEMLYDTTRLVTIRINKKGSDPGAVLFDSCAPACPDVEEGCMLINYTGGIPRSYAEQMIKIFDGKNMNTDGVWFPLKMFKEIAMERSFNGIRAYFGTYPDGKYSPSPTENYDKRNTFVLTNVDKNGNDDFYCDRNLPNYKIKNKVFEGFNVPRPPPLNNGALCPINCN